MILPDHSHTGWDCHAHVFGPYVRYPLAQERSYTPPEALIEQYLALLKRLGLSNGVLVHPSAYGEDFSLLLDVLSVHPTLRGVMVLQAHTLPSIKGLRKKGVRALRFSHRSGTANFAGSATWDDLIKLAAAMADEGLHAELWTDCKALPNIAQELNHLPVPVVIDHMGGFEVALGVQDTGFQTLVSLLESGQVWVKLCAYRNLLASPDKGLGKPFHEALVRTNPERLLWGSDWPHLRVTPEPDTLELLSLFQEWTSSPSLEQKILRNNPSSLYE